MKVDEFIESWYGKSVPEIIDAFSLLDFENSGIPKSIQKKCPLLSKCKVIGSTENLKPFFEKESVISGGPCIDDCHYDISIESVYEIASLIKVGKELRKKVIIHVGTQEEILREKQSKNSIEKWKKIGQRYENLIGKLKEKIGHPDVFCFRSDKPTLDREITKFAAELQRIITEEDARTLYRHLSGTGQQPIKDSFNFNIHTRFLALYLPDFVEAVLKIDNVTLLVYEDIQQLMAAKKARALAVLRNRFNSGPSQIIVLPYPSIDGKIRMHRSDKKLRPYLHSDPDFINELVNLMPKEVFEYNQLTWPTELTEKRINTRKELASFFIKLKECD